ncbi:hypothetical protein RUND412_007439 [Rhizina undulata]
MSNSESSLQPNADFDSDGEENYVFDDDISFKISSSDEDYLSSRINRRTSNVINVVSSAHEDSLQPAERTVEDEECTICVARIAIVQFGQGEVRTVEIAIVANRSRPPRGVLVSELGGNVVLS